MPASMLERFQYFLNRPQSPAEQEQIRRGMLDCVEPGIGYSVFFLIGCIALYGHVPTVLLIVAGIMMVLEAIYKIRKVFEYKAQSIEERANPKWRRVIWPGALYTGVFFGLASLAVLLPLPLANKMVLFAVYLGVYITSCWIGSSYLPIAIAKLVPLTLPLALTVMIMGTPMCMLFSLCLVFATAMSLFFIRSQTRQSSELVSARRHIEELFEKLSAEKNIAEQAVVGKSQFIASASHDLRQPLHALGLFHSAIRARTSDDKITSLMNSVDKSTAALNHLFEGLLDVSKLDAGAIEPNLEHFSIGSLFATMDDEFHQLAHSSGLKLIINNDSCVAYSDPLLVVRVLRNLLSNAIAFTEEGSVQLTATTGPDGVVISVSDTGSGIPESELDNIFNEFHQIDQRSHHDERGFGLGLAIVKRISRLLDFSIEVNSSVSKGTDFQLTLRPGDRSKLAGRLEIAAVEDIRVGTRVLIVDDNVSILDGMETALDDWGVDTLLATSSEEALQSLSELEFIPDLIICDYHLDKKCNGVDAALSIRNRLQKEIPFIIITGDTAIENLEGSLSPETPVLYKPVRPDKLREAIVSNVRYPDDQPVAVTI